jgi:hypothetical protein
VDDRPHRPNNGDLVRGEKQQRIVTRGRDLAPQRRLAGVVIGDSDTIQLNGQDLVDVPVEAPQCVDRGEPQCDDLLPAPDLGADGGVTLCLRGTCLTSRVRLSS